MTYATAEMYTKHLIRRRQEEAQRELNLLEYHASFHGLKFEAPNLLEDEPGQPGHCSQRQRERCETLHRGFLKWVCEHCDVKP